MALNITILGLNVVGGALGLALGTLDAEVLHGGRPVITGWDENSRALRDARDRLMVDRPARDLADAVGEADVVFACVGPNELAKLFADMAPHLKHGAIVSDVASVKTSVLADAQRALPSTVDFIGGHPLVAGGANLKDARLDYFKQAIYCLVPGANARATAIDTIAALVEAIGAKPYYIDAAEHDAYIATVQHLPVLLSAALMEAASRTGGWREMQSIAGEPFRLATEAAAGDPETQADVILNNRDALEGRLDDMIRLLVELRDNLHNREQLEAIFGHARDAFVQWQLAQPNMRPGETAFFGGEEALAPQRGIGSLFFGQRRRRGDHDKR